MSGREVAKRAERCHGMSAQVHKPTRLIRLLLGIIIQRRRRQRCAVRCPAAGAISAVDSGCLNNPSPLLQLVYMLSIVGWVGAIMGLCFLALKFAGIFRVDPALEEEVRGHGCSCTCSARAPGQPPVRGVCPVPSCVLMGIPQGITAWCNQCFSPSGASSCVAPGASCCCSQPPLPVLCPPCRAPTPPTTAALPTTASSPPVAWAQPRLAPSKQSTQTLQAARRPLTATNWSA